MRGVGSHVAPVGVCLEVYPFLTLVIAPLIRFWALLRFTSERELRGHRGVRDKGGKQCGEQ